MAVTVANVLKTFGRYPALNNVSLEARDGEFLALLGPSGSGKTTLLRLIAGLDFPDAGQILFDGEDVSDRPARDRQVGFVFQHYALFRHMTVAENIAFGLSVKKRRQRPAKAEIARRVDELLNLVQLPELGKRYPAQLSGGQRQRVALARALAVQPKLLLLDEPFGALDAKVRKDLRRWLRHIHDETGITSVFVTHDQDEALELADRVVVMSNGKIEQVDTPEKVYDQPATAFVADFLGQTNRLDARFEGGRVHIGGLELANAVSVQGEGAATAFIRAHEFTLAKDDEPALHARIEHILRAGPMAQIEARLAETGQVVEVAISRAPKSLAAGQEVRLRPLAVRAYPATA